jgi:hypothetical protein
MKSKNLILALAAIVFAVGSAFTTKKVLPNNVRVRWQQNEFGAITCKAIPVECNNTGSNLCTVTIVKDIGSETVTAKADTDCAVSQLNTSATPLGPYEAGNPPFDVFSE